MQYKTPLGDLDGVTLVDPNTGLPYSATGGGGGGVDREVITVTFSATASGVGYNSGDIIQSITTLDLSGTTPVVNSVTWRNQTQSTTISAPNSSDLSLVGQTGLTNAQLRASPVSVSTGVSLNSGVTDANTQRVTVATDQNLNIINNSVSSTGSLAALNASVNLNLLGNSGAAIDLRGTFVATVTFQGTVDGTNWFNLQATPVASAANVAPVSTATAVGAWFVQCAGCVQIRSTATAYTSGSVTVVMRAMPAVPWVYSAPVGATNAVAISGTPAVTVSSGTITTVSTVTASNSAATTLVADVASAALTTTTTTAAITPTFGASYQVNIPVTAVSGTTPTLDVSIEESDDNGTNWYKVYDFPRITATGIYRSPALPLIGTRIRYVQTVGGTTPSFTRAINRVQSSWQSLAARQLIDRTVSLTTLNSVTPTLLCRDCGNATQLVINVGAITTTAPQLQLEGSDDFGATWYAIGTPLTAVASSTVQVTVNSINAGAVRARVSTAGVGVTAGYVMIKAHD